MKIESTHDVALRERFALEFAATSSNEIRCAIALLKKEIKLTTFGSNHHNYLGIRKLAAERELVKRW